MIFELIYNENEKKVLITSDVIKNNDVYLVEGPNNVPIIRGQEDYKNYPEPYASGEIPPNYVVVFDALMERNINVDTFTWDELLKFAKKGNHSLFTLHLEKKE